MEQTKATTSRISRSGNKVVDIDGKVYGAERNLLGRFPRLTSCCGSYSTISDYGGLYCKNCLMEVPYGEGDGTGDLDELPA